MTLTNKKKTSPMRIKSTTAKGGKLAACDALGVDALCEHIIAGESQTAIAKGIGVSLVTLFDWISRDPERSARVREARKTAAGSFSDMAVSVLTEAADAFGLAKARELASHYRWQASKANPREYGDKIEIDQRTTFTELTEEQLDAKLERLINAGG